MPKTAAPACLRGRFACSAVPAIFMGAAITSSIPPQMVSGHSGPESVWRMVVLAEARWPIAMSHWNGFPFRSARTGIPLGFLSAQGGGAYHGLTCIAGNESYSWVYSIRVGIWSCRKPSRLFAARFRRPVGMAVLRNWAWRTSVAMRASVRIMKGRPILGA